MEVTRAVVETYTLTLTKQERDWLRAIVQNPIWVEDPRNEDPSDAVMRKLLWDALT